MTSKQGHEAGKGVSQQERVASAKDQSREGARGDGEMVEVVRARERIVGDQGVRGGRDTHMRPRGTFSLGFQDLAESNRRPWGL